VVFRTMQAPKNQSPEKNPPGSTCRRNCPKKGSSRAFKKQNAGSG